MPVDTSMYGTQAPVNPMAQVAQFAQAQNALNQNKLFQAQMAIGPILQQSIDPNTGQPDFNKAFTLAAQNPATAPAASGLLQMGIERGLTQQETALKALDIAGKRYGAIGNAAASLADLGTNITQKDVVGKMADLYGAGVLDKSTMMSTLANLPPDGVNLANWAKGMAFQAMGAKDTMAQVYGSYGERNALTSTQGPDGQPQLTPQSQVTAPTGPGGAPTPQVPAQSVYAPQGGGSGAPQAQAPQAEGPQQGAPLQAQAAPAAAGTPQGTVAAGPTKQMSEYLTGSGKNMVDYEDELNKGVMTLPPTIERIGMLRDAMKEFHPGGGQSMYLDIAKAMQATGWFDPKTIDKVAGGSIKDAQTLQGLIQPQAISNLKSVAQGTGRVMKSEVDAFMGAEDINTDPRALDKLFQFSSDAARNYFDQRQALTQYKALQRTNDPSVKGYDITDFPSWYGRQLAQKGGLDFGQTKQPFVTGSAGAAPKGATHNWVMRNGKLQEE